MQSWTKEWSAEETTSHLGLVRQLLLVQQPCSQFFDFWSFFSCTFINFVHSCLQTCVKAGQSIVILHTENRSSHTQGCTWLTRPNFSVQVNVKGGNLWFWSPWSNKMWLRFSFSGEEMVIKTLTRLKQIINVPLWTICLKIGIKCNIWNRIELS